MSLNFISHQFEGPLDLMLHLIKENKLDLFDLDLSILCEQYIVYIHKMQENQLSIASEYLSELAGLIEYKSKKLLPKHRPDAEVQEDENEQNLINRLLEYQSYKEASLDLQQRFLERAQNYAIIKSSRLTTKTLSATDYQHDVYDLIRAMNKLLLRTAHSQIHSVTLTKKEYSIDQRIDDLRIFLKRNPNSFTLFSIIENQPIEFQIVTFLAVLDMIRMNEIYFTIQENTIYLKGAEDDTSHNFN